MGEYQRRLGARLRGIVPPAARAAQEVARERSRLKGVQDGNCNREACQAPLKGRGQWFRTEAGRRLFYCTPCARMFNRDDASRHLPERCTLLCEETQDEPT